MFDFIKWPLAAAMLLGTLAAAPSAMACDFDHGRDGKIGHVFVIVLENEGFNITFGPNSLAPFLSKTLPSQGVMLNQYYGTGHVSLDNYIAMVSGQSATLQTRVDCTIYQDFALTGITPDGQATGTGCVYPAAIKTRCRSAQGGRQDLAWLHGGHGQKSGARAGKLRPAADHRQRGHPGSPQPGRWHAIGRGIPGRRSIRRASQPLRLLPFADRQR